MYDYHRLSRYAAGGLQSMDLIDEASKILRGKADIEIAGVAEEVEQHGDIHISSIHVFAEEAARRLGKKQGRYITIDIPVIDCQEAINRISAAVADKIASLLPALDDDSCVLLVGLGNDHATPDALGPAVVERTYATRHIFKFEPQETAGVLRPLAALAPGVLGITGIETAEMIRGVAGHVRPQALIVVDSLAAASISRVGTTIQIADSGISPGSGLGNNRLGIDAESMGIPVIAIGVPTVVNSVYIIYETLMQFLEHGKTQGFTVLPALDQNLVDMISNQVLHSFDGNMVLTPKDIDQLLEDAAEIIAGAIAQAVHPGVNADNYLEYLR